MPASFSDPIVVVALIGFIGLVVGPVVTARLMRRPQEATVRRTDVDTLGEIIERLQAENQRQALIIDRLQAIGDQRSLELDRLRVENQRLEIIIVELQAFVERLRQGGGAGAVSA